MIVDPTAEAELPDGRVGEIWLHGDNIGRGYWGRERETELSFHNKLQVRLEQGSHAEGVAVNATWFRTGDMGVFLDGELYITGRIKDLVIIDGRNHYPQDIEATVADASKSVRAGFVAAFSVPAAELPRRPVRPTSQASGWSSSPSAGRARARPTRDRSSMRSAPRCRGTTRCRWPTCAWSLRVRFRGPPAASWPGGPAGRSTWPGCSGSDSFEQDRRSVRRIVTNTVVR